MTEHINKKKQSNKQTKTIIKNNNNINKIKNKKKCIKQTTNIDLGEQGITQQKENI